MSIQRFDARRSARPAWDIARWGMVLVAMTAAGFSGCGGSGVTRHDVSGKVTFGGVPVAVGTITFVPAHGNPGPGGSAAIRDGMYDTSQARTGPTGGPHTAVITGFDGKVVPGLEVQEGAMLFNDYRIDVDLPRAKAVQDFDIPASARVKPTPPPPPGTKA
jgi:hypothetical protein